MTWLPLKTICYAKHPTRPVLIRVWVVEGSLSEMPFLAAEFGLN